MHAIVISVGTELTTGQCVDTNAVWLSVELSRLGLDVVQHVTVGDDAARLERATRRAMHEAGTVVVTGGLGPTMDDITREALASALGERLEEHPEAIAQIEAFFERWQRAMPASNRVQALIPRGCDVIRNERGTAPGIYCRRPRQRLFALPGVPSEMKAMFETAIVPVLRQVAKGRATAMDRLLLCGISEAKVGELLGDMMDRARNPLVGTTASDGIISVRVVARGGDQDEACHVLQADLDAIRSRLGRSVFGQGNQTLQAVVARELIGQRRTVSTAESCTGGLLAKRLTDVPGSSSYFVRGYVAYSNEAKTELLGVGRALIETHGAVSEPVARAMACGCRENSGTDIALAITGIAGPSGGDPPSKPVGLVFLALADAAGVITRRVLFGEHLNRVEIRDRSCKATLNLLRLRLHGADEQ